MIRIMNEQDRERNKRSQAPESDRFELRESEIFHGSGQSLNMEPGEGFVAPTMALDEFEPESKE